MIKLATRVLVAAVAAVTPLVVFAPPASAAVETWKGVTWDGPVSLAGGNLVVNNGNAHYQPSQSTRQPGRAFEATYIDGGPGQPKPSVFVEKEQAPYALAWFGVATNPRPADATHPQPWDDYIAQRYTSTISDVEYVGVGRRAGTHTIRIGLREDGKVDYWLDGCVTKTYDAFGLSYLGDIYLQARNGSVTYTNFKEIASYSPPTETQKCGANAWGSLSLS